MEAKGKAMTSTYLIRVGGALLVFPAFLGLAASREMARESPAATPGAYPFIDELADEPDRVAQPDAVAPPSGAEPEAATPPFEAEPEAMASPLVTARFIVRSRRALPVVWRHPLPTSTRRPPPTATPRPTAVPPTSPIAPPSCPATAAASYDTLDPNGPPSDRPAAIHADLNLALRGGVAVAARASLVDYGGEHDSRAPQLAGLWSDGRPPSVRATFRVYDWDWSCNCRGAPLANPEVTLIQLGMVSGETIHVPPSGYSIGSGFEVLVLYASEDRLTLKYTREDNVVFGYAIHLEALCVDPGLVATYRSADAAGRGRLPALRSGENLGRARTSTLGVAIRDTGRFMDPRSHKDWWQGE